MNIASLQRAFRALQRQSLALLLRIMLLIVRFFGTPPLTVLFKGITRVPGLRGLVAPLWYRALQRSWRRCEAVTWAAWLCEHWPRPSFLVLQAEAMFEAKRFDDAATVIKAAKTALLQTHRYKVLYYGIVNMEAMLAIERGDVLDDTGLFACGRSQIAEFCYKRAWDAHAVMNGERVRYFLNHYFRAINYDATAVFHACDHLMIPNGLWGDMIVALEQVEARFESTSTDVDTLPEVTRGPASRKVETLFRLLFRTSNMAETISGVRMRRVRALLEGGKFEEARAILEAESKRSADMTYLAGLLSLYDKENTSLDTGRALLNLVYADQKLPKHTRCEAAAEIAVTYEEARNFPTARQYYTSSFYLNGVPFFLPEYLWRYVSFCMAQGDYAEAAHVMREGLSKIWQGFNRLAKTPVTSRLCRNELIPQNGAFFIGCWGIGDDIIRIAMFDALTKGGRERFGFSVDPRMKTLYSRSFPDFEFIPISRMSGPFAVSEEEYVKLRDGIPPDLDRGRVDTNVVKATKNYPETALTEDILVAFIQAGPKLRREVGPLLKVSSEKQQAARRWLSTLPPGINVGIAWRSGQRDVMRNKSYTDLVKDWGPILGIKGINFINLQYSFEPEELMEAEARHGCVIHTMPGIDLKNDIEDVVALATALEITLAPGTAVREMCAAAGASVLSLSTTRVLPDVWRLDEDGERDRLFPNMVHVTAYNYEDVHGVLAEVASRLSAMVAGSNAKAEASESEALKESAL